MEDSTYFELLKYLKEKGEENITEEWKQWARQFTENNNHIYLGNKRIIPRYEVERIIAMFHDEPTIAHQNKHTIHQHISKRYIWNTMKKDIEEYTKTCWECQQRGTARQNNPKQTIQPSDCFERWGIDIVGPLLATETGNRYIIVAMDYFTRWPEAKVVRSANSEEVANFIYENIICRFGAPRVIQSDQGTHFVNQVIKQLTEKFRIRHSLSSPYHPQSNGLVERFNKTLCEGLAKVGDLIFDWDKYIQPVLFAYQIKELRISKQSSYVLIYGREPNLVMDVHQGNNTVIDRLLKLMDKVPQLRESA